MVRQPTWQRVILLFVLGYEGIGCLSGGGLLVAAPDGRLMNMPVGMLHGFFPDFLIPGLILIGMGILNLAAFVVVWRRTRYDWLLAGLALGGLTVWSMVEIAVLGQVHWLHAMWGIPVLVGGVMALPLIPSSVGAATEEKAFIRRHPALTYYLLVFAISFGGGLVVMAPSGLPATSTQAASLFPIAFLVLYLGPVVSGPLMTGLVSGRAGLRELLARLVRWRVGARWYAVALLTMPLLMTAIYLPLSRISPAFLPQIVATGGGSPLLSGFGAATSDKIVIVLVGLVAGLLFGFLEELGWTGFAIPQLKRGHGVLAVGLIVGFLWAAWHVPITFWASGDAAGALSLDLFLPPFVFYALDLPAYRVLMVWVYDRTESLLLATLMHASLIASTLVILPPVATGMDLVTYWLVLGAALWIMAVIATTGGRPVSRKPLQEVQPSAQPGQKRVA